MNPGGIARRGVRAGGKGRFGSTVGNEGCACGCRLTLTDPSGVNGYSCSQLRASRLKMLNLATYRFNHYSEFYFLNGRVNKRSADRTHKGINDGHWEPSHSQLVNQLCEGRYCWHSGYKREMIECSLITKLAHWGISSEPRPWWRVLSL
jgi:hypothetical protein